MDKYTMLGRTSLRVSRVGLGANAVGGHNLFNNLDDETGKQVVRTAIEKGINFIDTAFIYGLGHSEELIAEVVKQLNNREQLIIASKGAHKIVDGNVELDNSPAFLRETVEHSLQKLQTDYIDLFYLHFPDNKTPLAEAISALNDLKSEGKIKSIGVSNLSIGQLREANADGYVDVLQSRYSLLDREAEQDLLPYCVEQQISFVPYGPLSFGLLGGKYTKETTFTDWRKNNPKFSGEKYLQTLEIVERLKEIARSKGTEVAHLSLASLLAQKGIDVVIPGAKKPEQVEDNLKALEVNLSQDDLASIKSALN